MNPKEYRKIGQIKQRTGGTIRKQVVTRQI